MAAALRQLLNRGLLACRRAATAPPRAPRSFSTTGGVPQYHQPRGVGSSHLGIKNDANISEIKESITPDFWRHLKGYAAVGLVFFGFKCLPGDVAQYPPRSSKSPTQEVE